MKTFKVGTEVRLIQPIVQGAVKEGRLCADGETVEYRVEYLGADAEVHERWFKSTELETVPA